MGAKKFGIGLVAAVVVVGAWWVVPASWIDRLLGGRDEVSRAHGPLSSANAPKELAAPADALAAPAPERTALPAATGSDAASSAVPLPKAGHVVLRVVDARTRGAIGDVRVRFLSEKRFAEYAGAGELDVQLTSGRWAALVAATGYEPTHLESFDVEPDATTKLDTVGLSRGSGLIEGHVVARHLESDKAVTVQLFGDGRSRCDECRARANEPSEVNNDAGVSAACCGFTDACSEFALTGDRRFRFPALAAGIYWIRAFDPAQRIVASRRVELGRGANSWLELDVTAPTSARFELRHERGGLFTGDWSSVHHEKPAPIVFQFRRNGKAVGEAHVEPSVDDVRSTMGDPLLPNPGAVPDGADATHAAAAAALLQWMSKKPGDGSQPQFVIALGSAIALNGNWVVGNAERLDRERQDGDALAFDLPEPEVGGAQLVAEKLRPDEYDVKPLPRDRLTVVVSCGNYASEELPLDLSFERSAPLVVTLLPTETWRAQFAEIAKGLPAGCIVCHGQPNVAELDGGNWTFTSEANGTFRGRLLLDLGDGKLELGTPNPDAKSQK